MGMQILYEETETGIRVLRCFGECSEVVLPECILGKPVTELGDYAFSDGFRGKAEGKWWTEDAEKERCTENSASYAESGNRSGQDVPDAPALSGLSVCGISLPQTIGRIGRYAFYNCYDLTALSFYSTIRDVGAGAFTGCRKLKSLSVFEVQGERSCFKEILAELSEELLVEYRQVKRTEDGQLGCVGEARLLFPVYYEEAVENTPARILETHVHGCGHRYRYAFDGTRFLFREYDRLFPWMTAQGPVSSAVQLALGRLYFPLELGREAEKTYKLYAADHLEETAACLMKEEGMDGWKWLIREFFEKPRIKVEHAAAGYLGNEGFAVRAHEEYFDIWKPALGKTGLDKLLELSNRAGRTDLVSFLMDVSYRLFPPKRRRFEL